MLFRAINNILDWAEEHLNLALAIFFTFCISLAIGITSCLYANTNLYFKNNKDFTFLEVIDGDTIAININTPKDSLSQAVLKDRILVRIRGIDTPELNSPNDFVRAKAFEAKQLVEARLKKGKRIYLKNVGRDKYFRLLADLEIDGKLIADELIYLGLAYKYDGGKKLNIWE